MKRTYRDGEASITYRTMQTAWHYRLLRRLPLAVQRPILLWLERLGW